VRLVLDRYAPVGDPLADELRRDLAKNGYANHLPVVAFLARIGKSMAEDRPAAGSSGPGGVSRDPAEVLYGGTMGKGST